MAITIDITTKIVMKFITEIMLQHNLTNCTRNDVTTWSVVEMLL